MEIIRKIAFYFTRFNFHNPNKEKIVIFDEAGSDVIIKTILYDMPYVILPARGEFFYISINILLIMIKKIRFINLIKTKNFKNDILNYYYLSCIEYIKPKIVITFIEYNFFFQWVSKNYRNAEFIVIQNGRKMPSDFLPVVSGKKIQMYFPHFFCFGQNDIDGYKKYGHIIVKAYPVGSLKAGYYRVHADSQEHKKQIVYDICVISTYRESIMEGTECPEIKTGLLILLDFFKRFAQESGVRFCIAMTPTGKEKECSYFQKIFGEQVEFITQKPDSFFSSYEAIDSSEVSLTLDSALGLEAFGLGKKVLFCNFTGDIERDINCTDLCRININDYDLFSQKLKRLLLMEQNLYLKQTETDRKYFMNYNQDFPVHQVVRKLIEKFL